MLHPSHIFQGRQFWLGRKYFQVIIYCSKLSLDGQVHILSKEYFRKIEKMHSKFIRYLNCALIRASWQFQTKKNKTDKCFASTKSFHQQPLARCCWIRNRNLEKRRLFGEHYYLVSEHPRNKNWKRFTEETWCIPHKSKDVSLSW